MGAWTAFGVKSSASVAGAAGRVAVDVRSPRSPPPHAAIARAAAATMAAGREVARSTGREDGTTGPARSLPRTDPLVREGGRASAGARLAVSVRAAAAVDGPALEQHDDEADVDTGAVVVAGRALREALRGRRLDLLGLAEPPERRGGELVEGAIVEVERAARHVRLRAVEAAGGG